MRYSCLALRTLSKLDLMSSRGISRTVRTGERSRGFFSPPLPRVFSRSLLSVLIATFNAYPVTPGTGQYKRAWVLLRGLLSLLCRGSFIEKGAKSRKWEEKRKLSTRGRGGLIYFRSSANLRRPLRRREAV